MLARFLRRRFAHSRIWVLLAVIGPGIITANADNDATGILGYSLAGASYQYRMVWVLVLSAIFLAVAQEICARMGAVTGKGLADLIREEYGVKITFLAMIALLVANFTTTIAEFAGILAAVRVLVPPFLYDAARLLFLPFMAVSIWLIVERGTYKKVERILLFASLIYLSYVVSAVLAYPDLHEVVRQTLNPFRNISPLRDYVFVALNVIGTTVTPWGQFYIQSAIRDKGIHAEDYGYERIDVIFGSSFACLIATSIIVCCGATIYGHNLGGLTDAGQAAQALTPISGHISSLIFAIGLFNSAVFGAIVVPLSTAYAITEALGWESGLGRRPREAPLFIGVFTFLIVASAMVVIVFPNNLTSLIILPNIVGGVLLPIVMVLMLLLVNKKRIMGSFTNNRVYNAITWFMTSILVVLSVMLLVTSLLPSAH